MNRIQSSGLGQSWQSLGFGQTSPSALITSVDVPGLGFGDSSTSSLTSQSFSFLSKLILFINLPQVLFTLLYLIYNRSYTKMLAMHE